MKRAFTLIELLVVVLIIGILSAIALPQYTLSVNRARFSNLRSLATPFISAARVYQIANGTWPNNFDDMGLTLPGDFQITTASYVGMSYTCGKNDKMYCCIVPGKRLSDSVLSAVIECGQNDTDLSYSYFLSNSQDYCIANPNNTNAAKVCHSITGKQGSCTTWTHYTPTGNKAGDCYYSF